VAYQAWQRRADEAGFLAGLLAEALGGEGEPGWDDPDRVAAVCERADALARECCGDTGEQERVELLQALAGSARRGEARSAHRRLLRHLAGPAAPAGQVQ
jgi:hypothetical protein